MRRRSMNQVTGGVDSFSRVFVLPEALWFSFGQSIHEALSLL
jgi:hypothetical protein